VTTKHQVQQLINSSKNSGHTSWNQLASVHVWTSNSSCILHP